MPTFIRKPLSQKYLAIDIDSGGMSVVWTDFLHATPFQTPAEAKTFIDTRLKERFPTEAVMLDTMS